MRAFFLPILNTKGASLYLSPNLTSYIKPLTEFFKEHEIFVVKSFANTSSLTICIAGDSILVPCRTKMSWEEFSKTYYNMLDKLKEDLAAFCRNNRKITLTGIDRDQITGDIRFSFAPAVCITKDVIKTTDFFDFGSFNRLRDVTSLKLELADWLDKRGFVMDSSPITKKDKEERIRETTDNRYVTPNDILKFRKDNAKVIVCCYCDGTTIETYSTAGGWQDLDVDARSALVWESSILFTLEPEKRESLEKNGLLLKPVRQ